MVAQETFSDEPDGKHNWIVGLVVAKPDDNPATFFASESSIGADCIRAALEKLGRQRAVDKLLELRKIRSNPALAIDPDYQRTFNGFYRVL